MLLFTFNPSYAAYDELYALLLVIMQMSYRHDSYSGIRD